MNELILCGVVHVDICGSERLRKLLEREKPDCITLECAPENFERHLRNIQELDKKKLLLMYGVRKIDFTPFKQSEITKMNRKTISKFFLEFF